MQSLRGGTPPQHTHISQAFSQDGELGEQQKWRSRAQPPRGRTKQGLRQARLPQGRRWPAWP